MPLQLFFPQLLLPPAGADEEVAGCAGADPIDLLPEHEAWPPLLPLHDAWPAVIAAWFDVGLAASPPAVAHPVASAPKLRGHFAYYGITGNAWVLDRFRHEVRKVWKRSLGRRSQEGLTWKRFTEKIESIFSLPPALAIHSSLRLAANP